MLAPPKWVGIRPNGALLRCPGPGAPLFACGWVRGNWQVLRERSPHGDNIAFQSVGGARMSPPILERAHRALQRKTETLGWEARCRDRVMPLAQGLELPGHKGELLDGGGRSLLFAGERACALHPI